MHFGLTAATARPRRVGVLVATATISMMGLGGTLASTAQADACADADTPVDQLTHDAAEASVVCLVNQAPLLTADKRLQAVPGARCTMELV